MKQRLKKQIRTDQRKIVLTLKVNAEEMRKLLGLSATFSEGNMSEWVRYAALHFKPRKEDLS